jgi:hypothetical protein
MLVGNAEIPDWNRLVREATDTCATFSGMGA